MQQNSLFQCCLLCTVYVHLIQLQHFTLTYPISLPNVHHLNLSHVTLSSCIPVAASTAAPTGGKSCQSSSADSRSFRTIPTYSNIFQLSTQSCPVLLARLGRKHQVVGLGDLPKHVDHSAENPAIFLAQHRAKVQSLSRHKERPVSTWHIAGYL